MALIKPVSGPKRLTKRQAILELTFAGVLWGFGFVATAWALRAFSPVETLVLRFTVATLAGELLYFAFRGPNFTTLREELVRSLPAGLLLGGMLLLQTIGLQYTTATKSGFLTSLYVILVPLFSAWFLRKSNHWRNYALAFLALVGTFVLMDAQLTDFNKGDLWTLGCSIFAAFHILYIGHVSGRVGNAFRFNNLQSLWCLLALIPLLTLPTATNQPSPVPDTPNWLPWAGVLCLGLGSSVIAFSLQIRSQKILSDATASMLFLLESPFAALFGFLILSERLTLFQSGGALLILAASLLQILGDSTVKQPPPKS